MRFRSAPPPLDDARLRIIGAAMIGGVLMFGTVAVFVARDRTSEISDTAAWLVAGVATALFAFSFVFDVADRRPRVLSLAMRETTGLLGAVLTLMSGSAAWFAALGALSVVGLLAGLARGRRGGSDSKSRSL